MAELIKTCDCSDAQLVGAWNVLQFSFRTLGSKEGLSEKVSEVKAELDKRGIPNQEGKRIRRVTS